MARRISLAVLAIASCRLHTAEVDALDAAAAAVADAAVASPDAAADVAFRSGNNMVIAQNGVALTAHFWGETSGPGSCLHEPVAGCQLRTCEATPDAPRPTAGRITVSSPLGDSALVPAADGRYENDAAVSWNPGDPIRITAEGAEVPRFDETLTGPASIESLVAPEPSVEGVVVRRDQPLAVAWKGADEKVTAFVACEPDEVTRLQVRCDLGGASLTGSVPAEALSRLPAGCPNATVTLATEDRRYIEPGAGYLVKLAVRGPLVGTNVTLE